MYLALERFFFAHFWPTFNKIYKALSRCKKLPSLDFQKKSSFIGQGKNNLSIETVLENLPPLFLKERTIEEELQETFPLAAIFAYSLARGKKTEH